MKIFPIPKFIVTIVKFAIPLAIAITLLVVVFGKVDFNDFLKQLSQVKYEWVLLSVVMSLLSHWLRAYRWNLTLEPFGYQLTTFRTFVAVMTGYLANLAFPRIGEVTRCAIMKKNDGIPVSVSFGTVITERMLDLLILLSLIALDFVVEFDKIFQYFMDKLGWSKETNSTLIIVSIALFGLAMGGLAIWLVILFLRKEFTSPKSLKLQSQVKKLVQGLLSIRLLKNPTAFIASTIGIWTLYFLMSYVIFFSINETNHLGFGAGLSILAAAGVAMAVPVQGGFGVYHVLIAGVLGVYGIPESLSIFFASLLHTSQLFSIVIFGGISVLISLLVLKKKTESNPIS